MILVYGQQGKIQNATNEKTGVSYLLGVVDFTNINWDNV